MLMAEIFVELRKTYCRKPKFAKGSVIATAQETVGPGVESGAKFSQVYVRCFFYIAGELARGAVIFRSECGTRGGLFVSFQGGYHFTKDPNGLVVLITRFAGKGVSHDIVVEHSHQVAAAF